MNILILGGGGFLGKSCTKILKNANQVTIADYRKANSTVDEILKLSLSDTDSLINLIKLKKIDVVMHFISSLIPSSDSSQYLEDIKNVYIPTVTLLEYCSENNIGFIYLSSGGAIYGNQKGFFTEHTKCDPVSYYGLSKLNFEKTIKFYHNTKNLKYLIIRPSNPYGPGQSFYGKQGIIAVMIGKILKNEPIEIWGDGTAIKDYIYIDDFAKYVCSIMKNEDSWNNTWNIGSGVGTSINEIIHAFEVNKIKLPKVIYLNLHKSDVKRMILDCTKLQKTIDHKCINITQGISLFWKYTKKLR